MKPVNRYISLLLICGLMLPLYDKHACDNISTTNNTQACPEKIRLAQDPDSKTNEGGFSFFKDVISNIVPELKNFK